ncbi:hypothetical protein CC1G_13142 [Coprinopsis cinerea okayama7|uniref:DUF6534 domain-containing protein n=1 Tax=Coprinopsis cinerea (strain Okayama-7 / 130 / ATCC MYA-4618 / FGSC 9003) TaxID=240176 RepID=A8PF92_COPC7|nr:hypothetical protein CC1G_13142 [Coprinopsis cinerea okayama7\|eukprot:XP_001840959.1 hypothetical protein CC1G_13142 [Coprinopsis cinerea okayama7\
MSGLAKFVDLHGTIGALELGSLFSMFLFGVLSVQLHLYYQRFPDDRWYYKWMVALMWVLELGHTFCISAEVYHITISRYGDILALIDLPFLPWTVFITATITSFTHIFYSLRAWVVISKPWCYIAPLCLLATTARFAGSIWAGIGAVNAANVREYQRNLSWLVLTLLSSCAAIDAILAIAMVSWLWRRRIKTFARSTRLLDRIMHFTIGSGFLLSVCTVVLAISFDRLPDTMIWIAIFACQAKLYSNSVLASLNSRASLRAGRPDYSTGSNHVQLSSASRHREVTSGTGTQPVVISVEMKSTTHRTVDEPYYADKTVDQTLRFHDVERYGNGGAPKPF